MIETLLTISVCAVVPIGFGVFSDRASPELCHRLTSWPFRTMPATNGAIIGLLFVGGMAMLLYWVGVGPRLLSGF